MQTNLPALIPVPVIKNRPPIYAVQMADGQFGATLLSLCALLDIDKGRQVARIKRTPVLAEALVLMEVKTQGGRQSADVLYAWAISVWATGLHISRLPKEKQSIAFILQREVFTAIQKALTQLDDKTSIPEAPAPIQPSPPQSVWQDGRNFIDYLETIQNKTDNRLTVVEYDLHSLMLRLDALEAAREASPSLDLSPEHLKHVFRLARQLCQHRGLAIVDILALLAEHFRVEDVSLLPENAWPAVLQWFASLLEE